LVVFRLSIISGILVAGIVLSITLASANPAAISAVTLQKKEVTITAILDNLGGVIKWDDLLRPAVEELKSRHPELNIQLNYSTIPYNETRTKLLNFLGNKSAIDLVSVDQIWLGDFAQRGYLADISDYVKLWGRSSDWYQTNFDGGVYKGRIYGLWAWTDVRGIWYWKDLLSKAEVDPNSLKTWNGYIASTRKINTILGFEGVSGAVLAGLNYSPDLWYPYLWMLGGDILVMKSGHPIKGSYWFPAYNSSAGVKALEFIKEQIDSGIKPLKSNPDKMFVNRKLAVLQSGSWVPGIFPHQSLSSFVQKIGFIPVFPAPDGLNRTSTMTGGWEFAIPQTSKNKELAWELITLMVDPRTMGPWLKQTGFLPTQKSIGSGPELNLLNESIPYYGDMVSMIPIGKSRPVAPEYPQIAEQVRHAIEEVYYGIKQPKQALNNAARESAKSLGW
jgi:multiple sugar transport system substrate-binding protein